MTILQRAVINTLYLDYLYMQANHLILIALVS